MNLRTIIIVLSAVISLYLGSILIHRNSLRPSLKDTTLIVGTCDDYPPYTFQKNSNLVGFDIDLIKEIANRMSQKVTFKIMSFDLLLLELMRGSIHCVAAGITPTKLRAEKVLFSTPYVYGDPLIVVTRKDHAPITIITDLIGEKVGVNEGYTADDYVSKNPDIKLYKFENVATALFALNQNKISAFVTSKNSLLLCLEKNLCHNLSLYHLPFTEETCAFAISKQHPDLLDKINASLEELADDGTLEDLKNRWDLI